MSRPRNTIPRFCTDQNGRAFTKVEGEFITLGRANDPQSKLRYAALLERLATGQSVQKARVAPKPQPQAVTCNELALAFLTHAVTEYVDQTTGKPSAEVDCYKSAIRHLRELFGETAAQDFGPNKLRILRQRFIEQEWSRGYVGKSVNRIRHLWRWAVAREMVPASIMEGLRALEPLKAGKSAARETVRRQAVPQAHIDAVKKHLNRRNKDLVTLLQLTGARPGELVSLTTEMIQNRTTMEGVWIVPLIKHKNAHRGHTRKLLFNAAAQAVLMKYLRTDDPKARLFPVRRSAISRALQRACELANVPPFSAHWLRHTAGTKLADLSGAEAAQRVLGHATIDMTSDYTTAAQKRAVEAIQKLA